MILVTGATGHLGNVLVRELLMNGEKVRVFALPGENLQPLDGLNVEIVEGNILLCDELREAMKGVDLVYHLAALVAITPDMNLLMEKVNVDGTRNVIMLAREAGVKRLVYTSSIHALQRPPDGVVITEDLSFDTVNPAGAYDRTKARASELVLVANSKDLETVIVCPTGVIGPFDFRRSELGDMILQWMQKKPSISTDGGFDFVDVRDVAKGHIAAAKHGKPGQVYLLSGQYVGISAIRKMVQDVMGIHSYEVKFPAWIARMVAPLAELYYRISRTRPQFTRYSIETLQSNSDISSAKAIVEIGFSPRPLIDTIRDTVKWWQNNKNKAKPSLRQGLIKAKSIKMI